MPRIEISASDLAVLAGKSRWTHPWTLLEPMLRRMDPDRHSVFVRSYPMAPPDPRLDDYLRTCQEPLRSLVSEYVSIACACAKNPRLIADQIEALPRWVDTQEVPEGQRETLSRLMAGEIRCAYGKIAEDNYITLLESCPIMPDAVWQRSHLNRSCVITFLPSDHEVQLWGTPDTMSHDTLIVVEVKSRIGTRLRHEATSRAVVQTDAYLWTHDAQTAFLAEFVYDDTSTDNQMTMLRCGKMIDACLMTPVGASQVYTMGSTQITCRTRADADDAFKSLYGPRLLTFCRVYHAFASDESWQAAFAEAENKEAWYDKACELFDESQT